MGFIFLQKFFLKVIGTLKQNFTVEFPEFANLMQHPFVISPERKVPGQQSDKNKQKKKKFNSLEKISRGAIGSSCQYLAPIPKHSSNNLSLCMACELFPCRQQREKLSILLFEPFTVT